MKPRLDGSTDEGAPIWSPVGAMTAPKHDPKEWVSICWRRQRKRRSLKAPNSDRGRQWRRSGGVEPATGATASEGQRQMGGDRRSESRLNWLLYAHDWSVRVHPAHGLKASFAIITRRPVAPFGGTTLLVDRGEFDRNSASGCVAEFAALTRHVGFFRIGLGTDRHMFACSHRHLLRRRAIRQRQEFLRDGAWRSRRQHRRSNSC